jgi:DNA-binding NarL/FixJ family response regulator
MRRQSMGRDSSPTAIHSSPDRQVQLTKRQLEIALLVADGLSTKAIAARLDVTPKAVEFQRRAISKTIGRTALLVRYLIRERLLKP